jgi:hypothetical protein
VFRRKIAGRLIADDDLGSHRSLLFVGVNAWNATTRRFTSFGGTRVSTAHVVAAS